MKNFPTIFITQKRKGEVNRLKTLYVGVLLNNWVPVLHLFNVSNDSYGRLRIKDEDEIFNKSFRLVPAECRSSLSLKDDLHETSSKNSLSKGVPSHWYNPFLLESSVLNTKRTDPSTNEFSVRRVHKFGSPIPEKRSTTVSLTRTWHKLLDVNCVYE